MLIAVTSQNRLTVTSHAGMCRRFLVYVAEDGQVESRDLVEIEKEETFRSSRDAALTHLGQLDVFITGGMGEGLVRRLAASGIRGLVTSEEDPDEAVAAFLEGSLETLPAHDHSHGHDHGGHHH
jgi:predicted Fe-Mo cluster-binding NifX family protein